MNIGLNGYKKIINSQWGEDGILEEIFNRIGTGNKICVEFGAGNGEELSNVWHLINDLGWRGILIEPDKERFKKWGQLSLNFKNLSVLNQFIDIRGKNSLDNVLKRENAPNNIDLVSIDVDGDEYHIFKELVNYRPRVVVIEHNPTISPELHIVQSEGDTDSIGASAKAIIDLAHQKKYKLVAATHTNCVLVADEEFIKLKIEEPRIEDIFDRSGITYLISSYYGSTFLRNQTNKPSFTNFFPSYNIHIMKKQLFNLSIGFSMNRMYAENVPENFQAVKILLHKNENNLSLFSFLIKSIKNIINYLLQKI